MSQSVVHINRASEYIYLLYLRVHVYGLRFVCAVLLSLIIN